MRNIKNIDTTKFTSDVLMSIDTDHYADAEIVVLRLCNILVDNLDRHAPKRKYKPRQRKSEAWITPDILAARKRK